MQVVDVVGLEAEDRLDPVLLAGLVVLDRAVHHAVVGQAERRLPIGGRTLGELVDLGGAVEQRVLGVDVEMGDRSRAPNIRTGQDGSGGRRSGTFPARCGSSSTPDARRPLVVVGGRERDAGGDDQPRRLPRRSSLTRFCASLRLATREPTCQTIQPRTL